MTAMAMPEQPSLTDVKTHPKMTRWFDPILLVRLLWRVILSDIFGQYADRRLIVAALDTVPPQELLQRATAFMPGRTNEFWNFTPDVDGAVWVDYVADLGDGFDSTFAIASLLAQEALTIGDVSLPRGQALIMGGDEVYPRANQDAYRAKLRDPYDWAFPDPDPGLLRGPPVFALPGNHDWYDGLVTFLALFCRERHMHLGGWRTHQRRSYFALQVTDRWWMWVVDAQLADDVDQPQADYFNTVAKAMPADSRIILCGPEPGWLYTMKANNKALGVLGYVGWIAKKHDFPVPLVLSGDTHHYSRYEGDDGETQFITSGGGGAFLHSTHQVADTVDLDREKDGYYWLGGKVKKLSLGNVGQDKAVYPSKSESLSMLRGNFAFVGYNPGFAAVLGGVYWLLSLLGMLFPVDIHWIAPLLLMGGFWGYTRNQEGQSLKVFVVSVAHGGLHAVAAFGISSLIGWLNGMYLTSDLHAEWPRTLFMLTAAEFIVIGGILAGSIFGAYLYVTSRWLDMNHNDAFSSMRRDSHRNFLRMRIKDDHITVYPVGLTRIPKRKEWTVNETKQGSPPPMFVPVPALAPQLIEPPVLVRPKPTTVPA
jgi:hypothetical protein